MGEAACYHLSPCKKRNDRRKSLRVPHSQTTKIKKLRNEHAQKLFRRLFFTCLCFDWSDYNSYCIECEHLPYTKYVLKTHRYI